MFLSCGVQVIMLANSFERRCYCRVVISSLGHTKVQLCMGLMRVKSVETQNSLVGVVWKFGEQRVHSLLTSHHESLMKSGLEHKSEMKISGQELHTISTGLPLSLSRRERARPRKRRMDEVEKWLKDFGINQWKNIASNRSRCYKLTKAALTDNRLSCLERS
ncbi:hypothetical protein TNCV_4338621 [Trichonephila clavipes]|nr:hypothetical protein TNCV_4338621 [Trichonephila clavipes]